MNEVKNESRRPNNDLIEEMDPSEGEVEYGNRMGIDIVLLQGQRPFEEESEETISGPATREYKSESAKADDLMASSESSVMDEGEEFVRKRKNADLHEFIDPEAEEDDMSLVFLSPWFQSVQDSISEEDEDDENADYDDSEEMSEVQPTEESKDEERSELSEELPQRTLGNLKTRMKKMMIW